MSRAFDVLWSDIAERDLRDIIDYVARDGYPAALDLLRNIRSHSETLHLPPKDAGQSRSRTRSTSRIIAN